MSKGRILIVDDSELIRRVISDTFTPSGYVVDEAADGAEALQRVGQERPDLIIADILMPVMDGWALCEEIRLSPATCDIPFIFLTTERDVPKRIKGLEMGADDYVCKPFSKEELFARSEAVLRRVRAAATQPVAVIRPAEGQPATAPPAKAVPALAGHTDHIAMSDLLQLLSMNGRSGTLHLWGESVGRVYFRQGQIINAETQGLKGEKALFRIMAWSASRFEFETGEPAHPVDSVLTGATSSVLMEGFAHLDELRDLVSKVPPRGCRLRTSRAKTVALESMDLGTADRIILYTAAGRGATVAEIIDTLPMKDLEAYQHLLKLLNDGLLERADEDAALP